MINYILDLRGVACPMNFVKTKLFMDKMQVNEMVNVLLDPGEPVESVCSSIEAEGHKIEERQQAANGSYYSVVIAKTATVGTSEVC